MRLLSKQIGLIVLAIGLVCPIADSEASDFDASVRSIALGYSGVALISEQAAFYNPGALGLFYSDHQFASFSSLSSSYQPGFRPSGLPGISSGNSVQIGYNRGFGGPFYNQQFGLGMRIYNRPLEDYDWHMTVAVAYSGVAIDVPNSIPYVTQHYLEDFYLSREPLERLPDHYNDRVDMFSAAVALKGSFNIGLGGTLKLLRGEWDGSEFNAANFDLGLIASRSWEIDNGQFNKQWLLTPMIGISALNIGGDERLTESAYLLTRSINIGASVLWEMKSQRRTDASFLMTVEHGEHWSGANGRRWGTGRPDTRQNVSGQIFGGTEYSYRISEPSKIRFGSELGVFEALYLRTGQYLDNMQNYGFGLRSTGLMRLLKAKRGLLGWLNSHFDIRYDYAKVDEEFSAGASQHQLSISVK